MCDADASFVQPAGDKKYTEIADGEVLYFMIRMMFPGALRLR